MNRCRSGNSTACCCENTATSVKVSTELSASDVFGTWKARWGINRMNYKVDPGLYFVGQPDFNSPVLVTANYKMSFDALRKELKNVSAWILVLDTKGINVWCAAGKGTFGTEELVHRIEHAGLADVVEHRTVILPQLGAVGVSAHEVQKRSGFRVVYGPVRAEDIPEFLNHDMTASKEMRTVRFSVIDRAVLTPVEMVGALKPSLMLFGIMFLLNQTGFFRFSLTEIYAYLGAVLTGCVLVPILLPWIPFRAFSLKGWILGIVWAVCFLTIHDFFDQIQYGRLTSIAYILILPSVSAYLAMNFTGCSTFTSYSGVVKEMKRSIPLIAASVAAGVILLLISNVLAA